MIYPAAIVLLLFQFVACSIWRSRMLNRKDSLLLKQEGNLVEMNVKRNQSKVLHFTYSDSLKNSYCVSIVPDGEFAFSPQRGFMGKASSLQISGENANWQSIKTSAASSSSVLLDSASKTSLKIKEETRGILKEVVIEKKPRWGLVLLAVFVVVLIGVYLKRKY